MLTLKYLFEVAALTLLATAAAMLLHDLFRRQIRSEEVRLRWREGGRLAAIALVPLCCQVSRCGWYLPVWQASGSPIRE